MHGIDLISTLTVGFIVAVILGYITHRLGWSPLVGYLLAGIALGPHTPGFVANRNLAEQLAEIGVILLMFGVGLHFHLKDLHAVKRVAVIGALFQCVVATALGAVACRLFGWSWTAGLVFGFALSVASTVVLIRVLSDAGDLSSPTGRAAVGWLVMEDVFTVFVLVFLPALLTASVPSEANGLWLALGLAALKLAAFIALTLVGGSHAIPWVLGKLADTRSRELFSVSVLALVLGIAVGSAYFLNLSMALGAFLAGVVVGQSDFSARAAADALPLRDAFAVMFFVSVGMLFDPAQLVESPWLVLTALTIVLVGKPIVSFAIVAALGYGSRMAIGIALARAQIGEFSFLVAALAGVLKAMPPQATNAIVATAIVSIMLNPFLYRLADPLESFLVRNPKLWRILNRRAVAVSAQQDDRGEPRGRAPGAVIVGFGPIGQMVYRMLCHRGIASTVIEMNIDTHRRLRAEGLPAIYGDANRIEVLEQAGIAHATTLVLTPPDSATATEAIRAARDRNPAIHVVARAEFVAQTEALRAAGADEVFSSEGEVALAMADTILRRLGVTRQELIEARDFIRAELSQSPVVAEALVDKPASTRQPSLAGTEHSVGPIP